MKKNTRNSKNRKVSKAIAADEEDVFSALPDGVLCHILSFLDTKGSVATSVLSKRWKLVWTSVPILHLDDHHTILGGSGTVNHTCFANFVDRVLSLNNACHVRKFFLRCWVEGYDQSRVDAWMEATVMRDIENLDIRLSVGSLPNHFFDRKNLVVLKLHSLDLDVPKSAFFPSLTNIHLFKVNLLNDDSLKNLLSGCRVLEKLDIGIPKLGNQLTLYICSSTLKYLYLISGLNGNYRDKVVIEAPKLSDLFLLDLVGKEYHLGNLSFLRRANLGFSVYNIVFKEPVILVRILQFLKKITHIEYLSLNAGTMNFLDDANFANLPMLNNLTHLAVGFVSKVLPHLLSCSPNLVNFDFEHQCYDRCFCRWDPPHSVPKCLLSCLETFKITMSGDCDAEMEIVEYLLSKAMVLKKVLIRWKWNRISDLEMKLKLCSQLLMLPRSSSICKIELI